MGRSNMKDPTHYFYYADKDIKTKRYKDIDGSVILELRGSGTQTLIPPSIHPDGSSYVWRREQDEASIVNADELIKNIDRFASICLMARHWPEGSRHDAALAIAGYLVRNNWEQEDTRRFVDSICFAANDDDINDRLRAVDDTYKNAGLGHSTSGIPSLKNIFPHEVINKLTAWLGTDREFEQKKAAVSYSKYQMVNLQDFVNTDTKSVQPIIDGILWTGRVHWIFSDPGVGKTLLALTLGMAIAAGKAVSGRPTKQCPVMLIEEDSSFAVIREYIQKVSEHYDIDVRSLPFIINAGQGLRIQSDEDVEFLWSIIENASPKPGLIIFDSCERIVPSNSFNSAEIAPLDKLLKRCAEYEIATIVLDHSNKAANGNFKPSNKLDCLYGSRAKSAISDIMLYLSGSIKDRVVTGEFVKFRGEFPPKLVFPWEPDTGFGILNEKMKPETLKEKEIVERIAFLAKEFNSEWVPMDALSHYCFDNTPSFNVALEALKRKMIVCVNGEQVRIEK
jgi:hypothetical protein